MIRFEDVTITYAEKPVLSNLSVEIPEGELCLVVGRTGSGKSTFLRAVNGLVPHFSGGTLAGRVLVDGRDTSRFPPRELADVVGFVGQDPMAGFVADNVEDELAYSMESLGLPGDVMRKRVEETLDLLGLASLRNRPLATLSGGQQQRVAIGAALTAHPRILVLDEPTSALDPGAAEDVLAAVQRLVHDLGMTVVIAEHRLERVAQYADRALLLPQGEIGDVGEVLAAALVAPPVVRLAQLAGWSPVPVSVRDARRVAAPLRARLPQPATETPQTSKPVLEARDVVVKYGDVQAVQGVSVTVGAGERVALMGRNGSGKSSLLWAVQGSGRRTSGTVAVDGTDPKTLKPAQRRRTVALVPQQPSDLLYLETVAEECAQADNETGKPAGTCRKLLDGLACVPQDVHPRDLSEGQRLALVLAVMLTGAPDVLLLDEPTRGLDYPAKEALARVLKDLDSAIVLATHDVEFVAEYATRVIVMAEGEIVADGPAREVVTSSPIFAPQVSKILGPWLTVADVEAAL
ncbi:ATP-binding cassette domain-containing protein [Lentzea sp. BCCO 10_0856]|uniref:ATP-binding cassette domain-containing protein n=1 Tax=Lentzea miocenica TaxID=3095431 RepID=A0ABU4T3W6_9PSEU|nr:ATP-binding cassette domain-containing protein [Lentzea sp. BCCO 10_0856]MDX8032854.1 ATP-binding cassette domain-containing protein [Lentzea sp. BCCO 10_0856]